MRRQAQIEVEMQIANQNAVRDENVSSEPGTVVTTRRAAATRRPPSKTPCKRACARLQDAASELEDMLVELDSGAALGAGTAKRAGRARLDIHEAISNIMETIQLLSTAHASLKPAAGTGRS